jgi:hypothetical protein
MQATTMNIASLQAFINYPLFNIVTSSLLEKLWLALHVETLFGQVLDQGLHTHYLIVISNLDPVYHPVRVNILHAFGSPHGIPCPCLCDRSFTAGYVELDDFDRGERGLTSEENEHAGDHKENCEPPEFHKCLLRLGM